MQLRNCGEICVLDLSEIVQSVFESLSRTNRDMNRKDREVIADMVAAIFDDHLTVNMIWTKRVAGMDTDHYLDRLGSLIKRNRDDRDFDLIEDIQKNIDNLLASVVKLPTWHELHVRVRGTHVQLEMGQDYRITDWMKKYGKEYRRGVLEQEW